LQLRADAIRMDRLARVQGDAQLAPVARLLPRPAGLLGCDFDYAPHACV
jgi:hypothetical protein